MLSRLPFSDNLALAEKAQKGIPASSITELADAIDLTIAQISRIVQIPQRTLERRIQTQKKLPMVESERVIRLARLFAKAIAAFGCETKAAEWFKEPIASIGARTPIELCETESGAREVEEILGRIEHGVF